MRARLRALWREWGSPVAVALLVTQFGATAVAVDGVSMAPGLRDGEWLAVPKLEGWAHRAGLGEYARGDVVVFKPPREVPASWTREYRGVTLPWAYRPYLVKRVVGQPGDQVRLNRGELYLNGERVAQTWTLPFWEGACLDRKGPVASFPEVTVPPNTYFVMGDNRSPGGSLDSRTFGLVPLEDIAGRAVASMWPLRGPEVQTPPCSGEQVDTGGPGHWNPRLLTPPPDLR